MKTIQIEFRNYVSAYNAFEFFRHELNFDCDTPVRSWNYRNKNVMQLLVPFISFTGDIDFLGLVTEKMQLYFSQNLV